MTSERASGSEGARLRRRVCHVARTRNHLEARVEIDLVRQQPLNHRELAVGPGLPRFDEIRELRLPQEDRIEVDAIDGEGQIRLLGLVALDDVLRAYPNTPSVVMHVPSARSLRCETLT